VQDQAKPLAEWLSDFERPCLFPGFPIDLPFIYSDLVSTPTSKLLWKYEEYYPIDENHIAGATDFDSANFDTQHALYLNRMAVQYPTNGAKVIGVSVVYDDASQNTAYHYIFPPAILSSAIFPHFAITTYPNAVVTL
jgi:hypothetical protein